MDKETSLPSSKESITDEEYLPLLIVKEQEHSET